MENFKPGDLVIFTTYFPSYGRTPKLQLGIILKESTVKMTIKRLHYNRVEGSIILSIWKFNSFKDKRYVIKVKPDTIYTALEFDRISEAPYTTQIVRAFSTYTHHTGKEYLIDMYNPYDFIAVLTN